ncbi:hypothetical protein BH20ACI3_BH20ACI3_10040 [soil metagenome]
MFTTSFKSEKLAKGALGLMLFLVSPLLVKAQHTLPLWERIERTVAQSEPRWILVNKWPNPNPQFRVITYKWQLDTNDVMAWMVEFPTSEDAARELYRLASPLNGQPSPQCAVGDKCYIVRPSVLFFRKSNLIVRLHCGDPFHAAAGLQLDIVTRFAQLIASAVPAEPVRLGSSPAESHKDALMHREKAEKALREGRYEESVEEYKKAIELDADSAELHHALGLAYLKLGDRTKAIDAFKEAIRLKPGWAEAHYDIGGAHYEVGEYETAATSFEGAVRLKPDFFDAFMALGKTYQHSGLHPRSVEVLQKAVLLRPANVEGKIALGNAFILSGQPQEAASVLEEAVRLSPQSALVYSTLGQAYRLLGKFQEALGALQEALRISPKDPVTYNYLGMTYESSQRNQDALASYKQAIDFKSNYAEAHYNLALLYFTLGDRNQAQHHYGILKTISPDLAEVLLKKLVQ